MAGEAGVALAAERVGVLEAVEGMEMEVASGLGRNVRATMTAAETGGESRRHKFGTWTF